MSNLTKMSLRGKMDQMDVMAWMDGMAQIAIPQRTVVAMIMAVATYPLIAIK